MSHKSPPPSSRRYLLPGTVKHEPENFHSETSFVSNTIVAETSDEEEYFFPAREDTSASNPDRYLKQKISTHGKLAYVVYSGCSAGGVFYNWTAAAQAISGLEYSNKIYKGYSSYEAAHSAWDGFINTGCLPSDVAMSLGTRPYPTPPNLSAPRVSASPSTPQRFYTYSIPMPLTPRGTHTVIPVASPTARSTQVPSTSTSTQGRNAVALAIAREEAFRADQEDFWVVFTGTAPGVHQGREAGESAFGQFANPSFVRTSTREHANQIFVDGYMELLVARHLN